MPRAHIIEENEDALFDEGDWKELAAVMKPGGPDILSPENAEATLVGLINAKKVRSAYAFFRGYSYADIATPWALHRKNPVRHPVWPFLYCSACSFQFCHPHKNPTTDSGAVGYNQPKREAADIGPLSATVYYEHAEVTLRFSPTPYNQYDDDDPTWSGDEFDRNVIRFANTEPSLELLTVNNRFITFAEGEPEDIEAEFEGSLHERRTVTNFILRWLAVEESFVMTDEGHPTKLLDCVGRVNKDTFLGFAPQTLLMEAPRLTRYQQPVWTADGQGLYALDIEIPLSHCDPTPYVGVESSLFRGWNLFPRSDASGPDDSGPRWLSGQRSNGASYLEAIDFAEMFTHVQS